MTRSKRVLIETSKPLIYQHLKSLLAEGELLDLETMNSMLKKLPAALQRTSPQQVAEALKELGARELRQVRLRNGKRPHVWAVRRPEALREQFENERPTKWRDVIRR
jgi:FMN phosphatase YigB (HAD superfamily)